MFLFQLVYVSTAVRPFSPWELEELLRVARARNAERGITGTLLYEGAIFMQALEGAEGDVTGIYGKIVDDRRHRSVNVLWRGNVAARSFGEWTMGFVHAASQNVPGMAGYRDFLAKGGTQPTSWLNPSRGTELLREFRDLPWRQAMAATRTQTG